MRKELSDETEKNGFVRAVCCSSADLRRSFAWTEMARKDLRSCLVYIYHKQKGAVAKRKLSNSPHFL